MRLLHVRWTSETRQKRKKDPSLGSFSLSPDEMARLTKAKGEKREADSVFFTSNASAVRAGAHSAVRARQTMRRDVSTKPNTGEIDETCS